MLQYNRHNVSLTKLNYAILPLYQTLRYGLGKLADVRRLSEYEDAKQKLSLHRACHQTGKAQQKTQNKAIMTGIAAKLLTLRQKAARLFSTNALLVPGRLSRPRR